MSEKLEASAEEAKKKIDQSLAEAKKAVRLF